MPRFRYDYTVIETYQRLYAAKSFLKLLDTALPQIEWQEREMVDQLAEQEDWESEDYSGEIGTLNEQFHDWLPKFEAYSAIILLDSILETQLLAVAERVGKSKGTSFEPKDLQGKGLEKPILFLKRVAEVDVKSDEAWKYLSDLQEIRNIVVHRGGKRGDSRDQRSAVDRLRRTYEGKLTVPWPESWKADVVVSLHLCREFADQLEGFFKRLFKAVGLPDMVHVGSRKNPL